MALKLKRHRSLWLRFDRVLSHDLVKQLFILVVVLFVVFCLSFLLLSFSGTEWKAFCAKNDLSQWLLPLYLLIDTNALNTLYIGGGVHGWMLLASSIIYVCGVFIFNGMIISVMTNTLSRRVEEHHNGLIHYLTSGHYVVMGYDDMVPAVIDHVFTHDPEAYVLLLTSVEAVTVRERLRRTFGPQQMDHVIVNYGHRMSRDYYADICLESAQEIFIVGRRLSEAHDAVNVECVDSICRYLEPFRGQQLPSRITCVFEDLDTYAAFKTSEIFREVRNLGIEFVPYNFYAGWARQVFVSGFHLDKDGPQRQVTYPSVYGGGIGFNDERQVHLVFVGISNFSVAFAMEAANVLHFPNFKRDTHLRTRITFIDLNADTEKDVFITRNRHFFEVQGHIYRDLSGANSDGRELPKPPLHFQGEEGNFLDVEFEFIKGDVFSARVQQEIRSWATDGTHRCLSIFLAMADQRRNFAIGMNMPDEVYDNAVPLFIRQDRSDNFVTNLRNADLGKEFTYFNAEHTAFDRPRRHLRYAHIFPFGMNEMGFNTEESPLQRAKLINFLYSTADYEAYEFLSMEQLGAMSAEDIWARAEEEWRGLDVALRWSNLYCAYSIPCKMASLRAMRGLEPDDESRDLAPLTEQEVNRMACTEHNRWNVEKLLMGFRKARPEEDKYVQGAEFAQNKKLYIHHDIRPFKELDAVWRLDKEISSHLPWILKMTS